MIKKLSVVAGVTFFLTFLGLFFYFYRNSGKFRKLIASALLAALVLFYWSLESQAKSADAFTLQEQSRPYKHPVLFSGRSNNNNPEKPNNNDSNGNSENDDDKGRPQYSQPESVKQTKNRIQRMRERIVRLEEVTETDFDSETECEYDQKTKAGFKELLDSENFSYNMDQGRGLKKQVQKVWKNKKAKQEVLRMLKRFGDENANIQEKPLKGLKKLTELKNSGPGP